MTTPPRRDPVRFAAVLLGGGLLASWIGFGILHAALGGTRTLEYLVYAIAIAVMLAFPSARAILRAIGLWRAGAALVLLVAMAEVQASRAARVRYPLASWTMYSLTPDSPSRIHKVFLVDPGGAEHRVLPRDLAPFHNGSTFFRRLESLARTDPDDFPAALRAAASRHAAFDGAERVEWRAFDLHAEERPLRLESRPEADCVVPLAR